MSDEDVTRNINESADKIRVETQVKRPWQEKELLEELYHGHELTQPEMADVLGCTNGTVSRWMNKHDIEPRERSRKLSSDEDIAQIRRLYVGEEMSAREVAEEMGTEMHTIYDRLEENGIERRSISEANRIWTWKLPLNLRTSSDGYEVFKTKVHGEPKRFAHHRLMMVAEHGLDALKGQIVHHKNGISWDNRVGNLELMEQSDHVREHFEEIPPHEKAAIFALVEDTDYRTQEVADMFDTKKSTVTTVAKRIRDGDYAISGVEA